MNVPTDIYQALVISNALKLYAQTGLRANRSYTPRNMMKAAHAITGLTFKARDYMGASEALKVHADKLKEAQANGSSQ